MRTSNAVVALLVAAPLSACGGGDSGAPVHEASTPAGRQGGEVRFLTAADVDYLDPGQTYSAFGYAVQYAVNRPLYSYSPEDASTPRPDIAAGKPSISADQKTITVNLRPGVRYAPPVDREVTSEDIRYAFERAFSANVQSSYAFTYFADIAGAPARPTNGVRRITGIETPDAHTLVIRLERPVAATVASALVMPITVPVPREYAAPFDRKNPSEYDQHVAFTGPYMVRNDAGGKVEGRDPGRRIEIVRNPNWSSETDYRPAFLDAVTIEEGNQDLTLAGRRTLEGERMLCCDSVTPPVAVLRGALTRTPEQVGRVSGGGTLWMALNTTAAPFRDLNVRRAIVAGLDREALRLTRGGAQVGPIAQHFIPPGTPGFEESGGAGGFADLDFMRRPAGDRELAARYMRAAGHRSGRYEGGERVLAFAASHDPEAQVAVAAESQLEELGFEVELRRVSADTLFSRFCGVPDSGYDACLTVGWYRDIPDPRSVLEPPFGGASIVPQGNVNWSLLRNAEIDAAIARSATIPAGPERNRAWADINRMVVEQAVAIPYVWTHSFQLSSANVRGVMNPYTTTWDLSFSSLR
jgi:peptide/nickel transport system substrate-binding protein